MDQKDENGEDLIGEDGRNATQRRMDEEGVEHVPIAVPPAEAEPAEQ